MVWLQQRVGDLGCKVLDLLIGEGKRLGLWIGLRWLVGILQHRDGRGELIALCKIVVTYFFDDVSSKLSSFFGVVLVQLLQQFEDIERNTPGKTVLYEFYGSIGIGV